MNTRNLTLTDQDWATLTEMLAKGTLAARTFKRATALLNLHPGDALTTIAERLGVHYTTVATWRDYTADGLTFLRDAPRSGRPVQIDGLQRAKITALATSTPPEGQSPWSLRLLADKVVEAAVCESISHTHIGRVLKKNDLKPHLKQSWCIGTMDAAFLAAMEQVLALYAESYDPAYPVVCFDERPCFLLGDVLPPVPMAPGRVKKEHYAYAKHGSCALLAAIEPLTGRRIAVVMPQRTMKEYTEFCQQLAAAYPDAVKIRLVQDNLNTHHPRAFYTHLPADEAFALAQRFEFIYTPKGASWLNMIECEFVGIARQCLNRRIPAIEELHAQILTLLEERSAKQITIDWQLSIEKARTTLSRHYHNVHPKNDKYKKT